jgi:malate dehydrogenase (oxaloacetate-decarboxylating)(NADP+)
MENLQTQVARAMKMIQTRSTNIDKYLYLSSVKEQNIDLFYRLVMDNIRELMPLVYTPTIGDVCLQYSTIYTRPEALYISIKQRNSIRTMLKNWPCQNPEICVVTDGSRILGLGDLGINGVGISVSEFHLSACQPSTVLINLFCYPDRQARPLHRRRRYPSCQDPAHRAR